MLSVILALVCFIYTLPEITAESQRLRALIITVDNREITSNVETAAHHSMSAVLHAAYAKHHGYQYKYFYLNQSAFAETTQEKYPDANLFIGLRDGVSIYNAELRQFRSSPWSKVACLWMAVHQHVHDVDYVMFMDSDAAVNPLRFNRSISDALDEWNSNSPKSIIRGRKNPWEASMVFLSNAPNRDDFPSTGVILVRTRDGESLLREWWNYNIPEKNTAEFLDQDALAYMLESTAQHPEEYKFFVNDSSISLINEFQLVSDFYPVKTSWVAHVTNHLFYRMQLFRMMLYWGKLSDPSAFYAAVQSIIQQNMHVVNAFRLGEYLADLSAHSPSLKQEIDNRKRPQVYEGREDQRWHAPTHVSPQRVPPQVELDGLLMKIGTDPCVWLIERGVRRCFNSLPQFLSMGYNLNMVFYVPKGLIWYYEAIPVGPYL